MVICVWRNGIFLLLFNIKMKAKLDGWHWQYVAESFLHNCFAFVNRLLIETSAKHKYTMIKCSNLQLLFIWMWLYPNGWRQFSKEGKVSYQCWRKYCGHASCFCHPHLETGQGWICLALETARDCWGCAKYFIVVPFGIRSFPSLRLTSSWA